MIQNGCMKFMVIHAWKQPIALRYFSTNLDLAIFEIE